MKKSHVRRCAGVLVLLQLSALALAAGPAVDPPPLDAHILVDQFGYRPADPKVAVIRTPHAGYDAADTFAAGSRYEVRNAADGSVVLAGAPTPWNGGATQANSGDSGWWYDFSTLTKPGIYYVYDVDRKVRSAQFSIDAQVYKRILKAATRMYFYQRAGIAKPAPLAGECWQDDAAYLGPDQDSHARDITHPTTASKARDLSGGWFDAGDTNKYVTFAVSAVHQLLLAYQENPGAFGDDFNIPESGNGVPDILDEVKWETDWLKKMQYADGSVALKVGSTGYPKASPPSSDNSPRYYVPSCSSATIAAAGMFAHAAYVYETLGALKAGAAALKGAAARAWKNFQGVSKKQTACDSGAVKAGNADWSEEIQSAESVVSAIYLFAATGEPAYGDFVKDHYTLLRPFHDVGWIRYQSQQGEALLFYATLANADPELKSKILAAKLQDVHAGNNIYGLDPGADLYRNHLADYVWGSNQVRANSGVSNYEVAAYHIAVTDTASYRARALDTLHYFHGVNPFGIVYLSNMDNPRDGFGATHSVREIFHAWFTSDSQWGDSKLSGCGPAPGYVPAGPNADAIGQKVPASEIPPAGQPPQKSYKDWNGEDASWVVNEPAIYYQAAYIQLLAAFVQ